MVRRGGLGRWVVLFGVAAGALLVLDAADEPSPMQLPRFTGEDLVDQALVDEALMELELERARRDPPPPAPVVPLPVPGTTHGEEFPHQPRTEADLRAQLEALGLSPARIDELAALAEPALVLARRVGPSGSVPGGSSQVGGLPWLPPDEPWPTRDGQLLSLVAQIDLDAVGARLDGRLPDHGVLQFWLDLEASSGTPLPPDPVVAWWPDVETLEQREDGPADWGAVPIDLDFEPVLSVPSCGDVALRRWPRDERDRYCELPDPQVVDQLGGWPYEFQGDPASSIALRAGGHTYEDLAPPDPFPEDGSQAERRDWLDRAEDVVASATDVADWRLLLQLEMTPGDGMWADGGMVWFMARAEDLVNGAFDDVHGELASH